MGESVPWVPDDVSTLAAYRRENAALRAALAEARRERDEARRELAEYGRHQATCRDADYADTLAALVREGHDCECGWLRVPRGPDRGTR